MAFHAGQQINFEQSLLNNISSFTLKSGERLSKRIFEQPTNGLYPISSRVFGNTIVRIPLQFQKELLETQKENALENFDIAYAKKLNDEIASLTKEMEQSNSNAYTYESINNELSNINSQVQQHKAVTLINYLAQKSKLEAASILSSGKQELIDTIGTPWYNNVLTWNNTRK